MNHWDNTIIDFGCICFCGLTPAENSKIKIWWVSPQVHAGDKQRRGRHVSKDCATCKGSTYHLSKVHCEYIVKMLLPVCASFIPALFKTQIWWTTIKRNIKKLIKKREMAFLKNEWNKIMASNMGSMQFELWNMILTNHGCEQQIKKNDGILSKKIFRHF